MAPPPLERAASVGAGKDAAAVAAPSSTATPTRRRPTPFHTTFLRALTTFLRFLGPGLLMAVAFLDPGNMAADVNMGVFAGYTLLWVTLWGTVAAWVVQSLSARLGLQTGGDMATAVKKHYPRPVALFLLAAVELAVLATDMLESIGGAVAVSGLSGGKVPMWVGVLITCAAAFALLQLQQYGRRPLEALMGALVGALAVAVFALFFSSGPDWPAVFRGLAVPTVTADTVPLAVGALGALVMPHNVFLYSQLMAGHRSAVEATGTRRAARIVSAEAALALALTFAVNIAAVCVFARGFEAARGEGGLGLAGAGEALAALKLQQTGSAAAGTAYAIVWFVGLLASAQASTLTTSFAGQHILAVMFGLKGESAWHRYVPRIVTLAPAMAVAAFAGRTDEDGFAAITNWLNVITALMIPFAVLPLVALCASDECMGRSEEEGERQQQEGQGQGQQQQAEEHGRGCVRSNHRPSLSPEQRRRALEARGAKPGKWMLWVCGATALAILGMNAYNLAAIPPHADGGTTVTGGADAPPWPAAARGAWFFAMAFYLALCLLFLLPLKTWRRLGGWCLARWVAAGLPTHCCPRFGGFGGGRPGKKRWARGGKAAVVRGGGAAASVATSVAAVVDVSAPGEADDDGRGGASSATTASSSAGDDAAAASAAPTAERQGSCGRPGSGAPEPAPFLLDGPLTYVLGSPTPAEAEAAAESEPPAECELGLLPDEDEGGRGDSAAAAAAAAPAPPSAR